VHERGKFVSPTHRPPLPPGNIPGTHFCQRLSRPQGHNAAERIKSMKKSTDTIGNRTRDLPVCSAVPQPTAPYDGYTEKNVLNKNIERKNNTHFRLRITQYWCAWGQDDLISTATRYGLEGPGFELRWDEIFRPYLDQPRGPVNLLYRGHRVLFPAVKRSGRGAHHPPPSSAGVGNK
jgi:hypothetical protein